MKQSTLLHLLTTAAAVSFIAGCSPKTSAPTDSASAVKTKASAQQQQSAQLKVSYDAPEGWEQSGTDDMMIYTAPDIATVPETGDVYSRIFSKTPPSKFTKTTLVSHLSNSHFKVYGILSVKR